MELLGAYWTAYLGFLSRCCYRDSLSNQTKAASDRCHGFQAFPSLVAQSLPAQNAELGSKCPGLKCWYSLACKRPILPEPDPTAAHKTCFQVKWKKIPAAWGDGLAPGFATLDLQRKAFNGMQAVQGIATTPLTMQRVCMAVQTSQEAAAARVHGRPHTHMAPGPSQPCMHACTCTQLRPQDGHAAWKLYAPVARV